MNSLPPDPRNSPSDVGDRHRRFLAFAVLAIGSLYALSASRHLVGSDMAAVMKMLEFVAVAVGLGFLAPVFIWKLRNVRLEDWRLYSGRDGFVADALARAHAASWASTFILLAVLALFADDLPALPAKFFLEAVLATMLLVFSAAFLYLSRVPDEDEEESSGRA